jgi:hypothetical protein
MAIGTTHPPPPNEISLASRFCLDEEVTTAAVAITPLMTTAIGTACSLANGTAPASTPAKKSHHLRCHSATSLCSPCAAAQPHPAISTSGTFSLER